MSRDGYNGFESDDIERSSRIQSTALRNGSLPRVWECSACGVSGDTPGEIISHLEDYSNPVDAAIWLCYRCHTVLHLRDEHPDGWDHYREVIGRGGQYPKTRSYLRVVADLVNPPFLVKPPTGNRKETILDRIASGEFTDMSTREDVRDRLEAMRENGIRGLLALKDGAQESLF